MPRISFPSTARLPSSLRVDSSNPAILRILNRLSRISLATLVLDWLDENHLPLAAPYLRRDDDNDDDEDLDDFYPPARSPGALQELYADLQARKGSKREVLDRVTEGDWRHGLTLYQLAMADLQYLYDHPTFQKWSAYRIVPLKTTSEDDHDDQPTQEIDKESLVIPRFHPSTFLRSLQETVLPDIKAHYNFDRHKTLPLLLLRIFILDSPYNTNLSVQSSTGAAKSAVTTFDVSRTVYIAFPDSSPYIYISKPQVFSSATSTSGPGAGGGGESKSLRTLIVEGIPKALSRPPHQRFTLKSTNLTTKNLNELLDKRGGTRTNSAGGGWSIYADESVKESPLDTVLPLSPPLSDSSDEGLDDLNPPDEEKKKEKRASSPASARDERALKRARLVAKGRFGNSAKINDGKGVERVDIIIEDAFPSSSSSRKRKRQGQTHGDDNDEGDSSRRPGRSGKGRKSAMALALGEEESNHDDEEDQDPGQGQGQRRQEDQSRKDEWRPNVKVIFHGAHVFAGIRQLVERGVIDGERMPGWMTGEEGVTMGAVRTGRIRGYKGSGL